MPHARTLACLMLASLLAVPAAAQAQHRHAGAHVHGSGKLDIAIEGNKLSIALDSPADDILGFEHAPKTAAQKAKLEKAVARLKDAATIFKTPADAACKLIKAEAGLEQPDPKAAKPSEHADFTGAFEFECGAIAKLTSLDLGYFAAFPGAGKLAITIVTTKAQTTREATKSKPRIDLKGLN